MAGDSDLHAPATTAENGSQPGWTPRSVLLATPRWVRDGGVGAHVMASARLLADSGIRVHVLAAQVQDRDPTPGITLEERPALMRGGSTIEARLGDAAGQTFGLIHFHQVDDRALVHAMQPSSPVVISAHAYTACPSGVYYFRPGQECTRGHGLGCIPNLLAGGCAHTRYPKTLPVKFRNAARGLAALLAADLVISYSNAVDRHLAANRLSCRAIVPYFPTMQAGTGSGHGSRRRVVFAGRLVRTKGVDVLLHAAREVDGEFVICGTGRDLEEMRDLAARLGVAERIDFKGWLDGAALADELANASVVVVPSLWPEPFGLVGIEALAAGRPAVASATGGIVDWLEDGVGGLCVPPGDAPRLAAALNELLADPARQAAMGAAGRRLVAERFSPECHLTELLGAYRGAHLSWQSAPGRRAAAQQ